MGAAVSVRDHRKGARKVRHKLPDYVRKAGPHQPARAVRKSTTRHDVLRRAIEEYVL
jgi:hypothetical protein